MGNANIGGEMSFSCKVRRAVSSSSLKRPKSFLCVLCSHAVDSDAMPVKLGANRPKTLQPANEETL